MVQQVIGVFTALRICSLVPKPRKLVIVTDIVPRLCIGEHLHHGRPVRHVLLRRHQLPIADSHIQNASAQLWSILEQPESPTFQQIAINQAITSNTQSQVTLKNIGPGFLHFTQPSEFQQLTQFPDSQVVPNIELPGYNHPKQP